MTSNSTPKTQAKDWTRKALLEIFDADTQEIRLDRLRRMGVLDENNNLTDRVTNWGADYISYTLVEGDEDDSEEDDDPDPRSIR